MDAIISLIDTMDDLIAEYQIDSNGLVEKNFRVAKKDSSPVDPRIRQLLGLLAFYAPASAAYSHLPIETISYHPQDGLTYANPTMVVVYACDPTKEAIDAYDIPNWNFLRKGFAIKWDLVDGTSMAKLADLDYANYEIPKLPWFTKIGYQFGVGIHFSKDNPQVQRYADFYVASRWRLPMQWFFGDLYPKFEEDFRPRWRAYAVCVDLQSGKVVKLKRYIYWKDKTLKDLDLA